MSRHLRARNVVLILVGAAGLLLKRWLAASMGDVAYSHVGNVFASFAAYFIISIGASGRFSRFALALAALTLAEAFELTNGFGFMSNVYDPFDLLANAIGVGLALAVDLVLDRIRMGHCDAS